MLVGVQRQADRGDAGDAVALEHAHQLALGGFQAGDEGLESLVLALFLADRGERAAQIIGDREDIAREFGRSEEHTSELQSLMRISYAVFCLKKKKNRREIVKTNISIMSNYENQHKSLHKIYNPYLK